MDGRAQQQRRWMRITAIVAPYVLWVGIAGGFTAAIGVLGGMPGTSHNQAFQGARNSGRVTGEPVEGHPAAMWHGSGSVIASHRPSSRGQM